MEDEVVTEGFLLPRKTSARQLEERSQRALQNQKLSIFSGAGSGLCRPGRLGTAAPWSCGKGLPGSLRPWIRGCWELNAEFAMGKEENWRLVSQSNCSLYCCCLIFWMMASASWSKDMAKPLVRQPFHPRGKRHVATFLPGAPGPKSPKLR